MLNSNISNTYINTNISQGPSKEIVQIIDYFTKILDANDNYVQKLKYFRKTENTYLVPIISYELLLVF